MYYNKIISAHNPVTLEVTVENLSPQKGGIITPVWFALHDGNFKTFEVDKPASSGVMYLAEDGIVGLENTVPGVLEALLAMGLNPELVPPPEKTIAGIFASSSSAQKGGTQGIVDSVEKALGLLPGDSLSTTVTIERNNLANNRYFNYGAMFFPSNDALVANDKAIEVFDSEGNFVFDEILVTRDRVWDIGTEVNDENPVNVPYDLDTIGKSIDEGGTVRQHQGFKAPGSGGVLDFNNGFYANADFTKTDAPIARISIVPVIKGTFKNDLIVGSDNGEKIAGLAGNDIIISKDGDDTVKGGAGNDRIKGNDGDDKIDGGSGKDTIDGGDGDDILSGGDGNDILSGGDGDDILSGGNGKDILIGGDGDDILIGSNGTSFGDRAYYEYDVFKGGDGADIFVLGAAPADFPDVFYLGAGFAKILDFSSEEDKIQLAGTKDDYHLATNSLGTAIVYQERDLIGFVLKSDDLDLSEDFEFVSGLVVEPLA